MGCAEIAMVDWWSRSETLKACSTAYSTFLRMDKSDS
jgi:hypothetical protein